jgi:hypothetical protein
MKILRIGFIIQKVKFLFFILFKFICYLYLIISIYYKQLIRYKHKYKIKFYWFWMVEDDDDDDILHYESSKIVIILKMINSYLYNLFDSSDY